MRIFGAYKRQRLTLDVAGDTTVAELKDDIQHRLGISSEDCRRDNKVMALTYAGAELSDSWILSDLVIIPGVTIKIQLKDNIKPSMYIKCSHNQEIIKVFEDAKITSMQLEQFRSLASKLTGLPVGIFRVTTQEGREMFDTHRLKDYGVEVGQTVLLETWDGWNEFLNVAIMGFTPQVVAQINGSDVIARFQMKVALFIASHFGHVDLARCALRQGICSHEPTGYHPSRKWCQGEGHIDSLKCPVHEATECGQVGVLRLFVTHDISCLKAKDGHGLEPINIALRQKVKNCAAFLLSKQWTKVPVGKNCLLHVATYANLRSWCDRAKERAYLRYGPERSSQKQRTFNSGPLVSHGIFLDGFSPSPMTGKSKNDVLREEKEIKDKRMSEQRFRLFVADNSAFMNDPELYFRTLISGNGAKSKQRQRKVSSQRWQKPSVSSMPGDVAVVGQVKGSLKLKPDMQSSHSSKPKTSLTTTDSCQFENYNIGKLQSQNPTKRKMSSFHSNSSLDEIKETQEHTIKVKHHQNSAKVHDSFSHKNDNIKTNFPSHSLPLPRIPPANSEVYNTTPRSNYHLNSSLTGDKAVPKESTRTRPSEASVISDDTNTGDEKRAQVKKRKGTSRKLVPSIGSMSSKSCVTLPDISREQNRRPFYYYNGVREDELVGETLKMVEKYKGDSSRGRAVNMLGLASSFSEKPWLYRVRMALNLTNKTLKRSVRGFEKQNLSLAII